MSHVKYSLKPGNNLGTYCDILLPSGPGLLIGDPLGRSARSRRQIWRIFFSAILKFKKKNTNIFGKLAEKLLTFHSPPKLLLSISDSIILFLIQKSCTRLGSEYPTFRKSRLITRQKKKHPFGWFLATRWFFFETPSTVCQYGS